MQITLHKNKFINNNKKSHDEDHKSYVWGFILVVRELKGQFYQHSLGKNVKKAICALIAWSNTLQIERLLRRYQIIQNTRKKGVSGNAP